MGCWGDFKNEAIEQAFESLQPGGWFECQEFGSLVECDDGSLPADCELARWAQLINEASSRAGRPRHVAPSMLQWFQNVGFVDVHQVIYQLPIGRWGNDDQQKELGAYWQYTLELGVEVLTFRLLWETRNWSQSEIEVGGCTKIK